MNIWHAWRQSLSPQQPLRRPLLISHTQAVCSAAPGAVCTLQLGSPVSLVEHQMLVLVLSLVGTQSCCFSWIQAHLSAGSNSPGPTCWQDPWPHSRVSWNSGWEDPWTAQRHVVTEWTRLCHHYIWEYQFICWQRLNPKLHHLLFFSDSSHPHSASESHWQTNFKALFSVFGSLWLSRSSQNYSLLLPSRNMSLVAPVGCTLLGFFLLLGLTFFTSSFFPCMETPDSLVHSIPFTHPVFTITGIKELQF